MRAIEKTMGRKEFARKFQECYGNSILSFEGEDVICDATIVVEEYLSSFCGLLKGKASNDFVISGNDFSIKCRHVHI